MTKEEILAGVGVLAAEIPLEELPELVGQLARAQAIAILRVGNGSASTTTPESSRLLTVEDVAAMLRISDANVYARSKTDMRAAVVDVGPGQLRFDPKAIERFISARRRE